MRLRPFRAEDIADVVDGCADPLTQRFISDLPTPYTETDARWWIDVGAPAAWTGGGTAYAIADPATDRLLGAVGLSNPVPARGQAEIGYWMRPAARGRGLATAATRALSEHAFAAGAARLELLTDAGERAEPAGRAGRRLPLRGFAAVGRCVPRTRAGTICWPGYASPVIRPARPPGCCPICPTVCSPTRWWRCAGSRPDDAALMYRLHSRPEVVANQAPPVPPTREAIERRCRLAESGWLTGDDRPTADHGRGQRGAGGQLRAVVHRRGQSARRRSATRCCRTGAAGGTRRGRSDCSRAGRSARPGWRG